jgi:hypothetical protein
MKTLRAIVLGLAITANFATVANAADFGTEDQLRFSKILGFMEGAAVAAKACNTHLEVVLSIPQYWGDAINACGPYARVNGLIAGEIKGDVNGDEIGWAVDNYENAAYGERVRFEQAIVTFGTASQKYDALMTLLGK